MGCYSDKVEGRSLSEVYFNDSMTVEACMTEAKKQKSRYLGLQYGAECFHGNKLDNYSQPINQTSKCTMPCPGNSTTLCGGPDALQLYRVPLECPADNGTTWSSLNSTAQFVVQCSTDREGGSYKHVWADTFEDCMIACGRDPICKNVAMRGRNCYLKSHMGNIEADSAIWGATVVQR